MANELIINYPTGATLYALLFDGTGQVWNGSSFVAPGSADWTNYDIAMPEVATATGVYLGTMTAEAAGVYGWTVRKQAGGTPAVSDITVGVGRIEWTGTAEIMPASTTNITAGTINSVSGSIGGDVAGKVLGGGEGTISGVGTSANVTYLAGLSVPVDNLVLALGTGGLVEKLNSMLEAAGLAYRFTAAALAEAPTEAGIGAITFTYTLTSSVNASPIADADVWVTTDSAGSNVIAVGRTNAAGQGVFYLDAGTVDFWRQKTGWTFANPDTEVVA